MKKIAAVAVILVMSCLCSSSLGYLLLYKVSTTVYGADANLDDKETVSLKGYLLLRLSDANEFEDANLMLYGKDTDNKRKYVILDYNDGAGMLSADVWYIDKLVFVDLSGYAPFDLDIFLSGSKSRQNVGLGNDQKKSIASNFSGIITLRHKFVLGPSVDQDYSGKAGLSAWLWESASDSINGDSGKQDAWTQDEVISTGKDDDEGKHYESLTEQLIDDGYDPATLPPD
jgi:hypothetical protein